MKTNRAKLVWISLGLFLAVFSYYAIRAHLKIVTLNVQNADVREVIRKIQWQVWEPILVSREVRGRVTLHVRNVHLEEVLSLIEQQTGGHWTLMYPLYSTRRNINDFKKAVRGEMPLERSGWTNLARAPMGGGPQMKPGRIRSQIAPVSLQVTNCDLRLVLLALTRFGNVSVVPMNGTDGNITFRLEQTSIKDAVKRTAKYLGRKATSYYAVLAPMGPPPDMAQAGPLEQGPFPLGGPEQMPPPPGEGEGFLPPPPPGGQPPPPPPSKEQEQQREADYKALVSILPAAQRTEMEMERKMSEALRSKPPEEHQQMMNQLSGQNQSTSENEQRNKGLLITTPQQRVAIDRAGSSPTGGNAQQKSKR